MAIRTLLAGTYRSVLSAVQSPLIGWRLCKLAEDLYKFRPVEEWPRWVSILSGINLPSAVSPSRKRRSGGSNIKIILELLNRVRTVAGDVAECGVWRGNSLITMAIWTRQAGVKCRIVGYDSFAGFGQELRKEMNFGGEDTFGKFFGGFGNTTPSLLRSKASLFGVEDIIDINPGFFCDTFVEANQQKFRFVHLDCDLYDSYKQCLEYFYPRLASGAIVLLDEYNDPPWPGCNKAVDEFLATKTEKVVEIVKDNQFKYYFVKQ